MTRERVLIIAEAANPEWTSVPLVGWSHAMALAKVCDAHIVTQVRNAEAFARAGVERARYTTIDSEGVAKPLHKLGELLRGGSGRGWTTKTALAGVSYRWFERLVWKEFAGRLRAREFDLVHRITPLSPTTPSSLAGRCARAGVPFVLGPLNGGVPWPKGFDAERRREREWLSYARAAYRWMPGHGSTFRHAAAIIVGSRDTRAQLPASCLDKSVYIPENAVDPARFSAPVDRAWGAPLRVAFLGRLVPYKGCDMLLDAAAELVRSGRMVIDVIGDGPERGALEARAERLGIRGGVQFAGWMAHEKVQERLGRAHVLGFPSIREFGGGVVLEAMALGVVPLIVDYAGPAELVTKGSGFAVPVGPRGAIIAGVGAVLERLVSDMSILPAMADQARRRALELFTWDAKAGQVQQVYRWVLGRGPKPDFGMPFGEGRGGERA